MSSTTPPTPKIDYCSRPTTENAVDDEMPSSQPSSAEHSQIHDQLTAPMGSYKMAYTRHRGGNNNNSSSESDVDNHGASDDADSGDDEKSQSVHLSNYASDEAVSYVESCESFDRYTDSSDEEVSDEENNGGAKEKGSAGRICRRRESNSDTETSDESEEENERVSSVTSEESGNEAGASERNDKAPAMNNFTEAIKQKSSEKYVGIWDDDGVKRRRSSNPVRKLWSDYVYKPDKNQSRGQLRAGARFTNSFTDKRQHEPVDQSWSSNHSNRFPPPLGVGLGRGLMPGNDRHRDPNNMRPPGPGGSWQQQRRPNNPYCHHQQQQKYFGMPRGSYASVVQKGPANTGRADSRNTNPTRQPSRGRQCNDYGVPQQSHNNKRQNQNQPQRQQQSYNRCTVTGAQILQQQRMQQSHMQQSKGQQDQQRQGNTANWRTWQPPKGPNVRPLMIGTQQVYVIQPSWNRRPIAEEDPAIVRADPPVPQPYIMLPGGIPLALPMAMRGNPAGLSQTSGSGGMHGVDVNRRAMPVH